MATSSSTRKTAAKTPAKKTAATRTPAKTSASKTAAARKAPQDRKPKSATTAPGTFWTGEGERRKKHTLPAFSEKAAMQVPGDVTYDLMMNPEDQQANLRLGFLILDQLDPAPDVLAALKSLPTGEMIQVVGRWMGESSGSSD